MVQVNGSVDFTDPNGDLAQVRITIRAMGQFTDANVNTTATSGTIAVTAFGNTNTLPLPLPDKRSETSVRRN